MSGCAFFPTTDTPDIKGRPKQYHLFPQYRTTVPYRSIIGILWRWFPNGETHRCWFKMNNVTAYLHVKAVVLSFIGMLYFPNHNTERDFRVHGRHIIELHCIPLLRDFHPEDFFPFFSGRRRPASVSFHSTVWCFMHAE